MTGGDRLHRINAVLLLASLAAATVWPFETLLLAYAVLGPLHYLTEISWLHERQYFLPTRTQRRLLWLGLGMLLIAFSGMGALPWIAALANHRSTLMFAVFAGIGVLVLLRRPVPRLLAVAALAVAGLMLQGNTFDLLMQLYLATLIHVFVFTNVFVWVGIRRRPSRDGYLFALLFLCCPLLCWLLPASWSMPPEAWANRNYALFFATLNYSALRALGQPTMPEMLFNSATAIDFTRFVAFAYSYHYLNWFSKTNVIQWHRMPQQRGVLIGLIWIASIALYVYDYVLGFILLLALSFAHVVLEFPLDHLALRQVLARSGTATKPTTAALVRNR